MSFNDEIQDAMDEEIEERDETKRLTRNLCEKKRRDQFTLLVNELGSIINTNKKKMDKSTILKSTINFIRNHNEVVKRSRVVNVKKDWKPPFMSNDEYTYLILETMESFILVFSSTGNIIYVSESIASLLGYTPHEVINKSILDLVPEEEQDYLYNLIQNTVNFNNGYSNSSQGKPINFQCHMLRAACNFKETNPSYDLMQFAGHFRKNMEQFDTDHLNDIADQNAGYLFIGNCTLCTPQLIKDVTWKDTTQIWFLSRLSLEWKFLFLDHRAPPIIGYLPHELLGTSGYDYYNFDDLEIIFECHDELMRKGEVTSGFYRFLTKSQQWIWLQTRFYITYHQWSSKPEFIVCTHRVVSNNDTCQALSKEEGYKSEMSSEAEHLTTILDAVTTDDRVADVPQVYMTEPNNAYNKYVIINLVQQSPNACETITRPEQCIGTQYLAPNLYFPVQTVSDAVTEPELAETSLIVLPQNNSQSELQQKHEALQKMVQLQQEELRIVKEELAIARCGLVQPVTSDAEVTSMEEPASK